MAYRPGKCQLHHILRENNLTLTDLAKLTGIRFNQLSDYANDRNNMSYPNAFNIALSLGIPMEDLYETVEYFKE